MYKNGLIAAASVVALAALPAFAADTVWKVQIWGPKRASTELFEKYAKDVAARTNGQMKMEIAYGKGTPTESADLLKSGAVDGAYFCAQYYADKMPLTTVIDLPMFAPANLKVMARVELALADQPAIDAELAKWNAKLLLPTPMPQYQLMGMRRVGSMDDLKGARVRISGEMGKILGEYGALPSVIASTESAAALKAGKLDLVALPYSYSFATFKIDDASKYVTDKISLGAPLCFIGANRRSWEALPAATRKAMTDARDQLLTHYEDAYTSEDAANIANFKSKGIEFVDFKAVDRARLVARAIKVWQAWVDEREKQGLPGREVFEFTQQKIRESSK
jgi:TRAP-type C4-dicarboxylate transport system substrate-binding protein